MTEIYWADVGPGPRVAVVGRPRGGDGLDDDLRGLRSKGVDVLVSMLTVDEAEESGLEDEAKRAEAAGLEFHSFPIEDMGTPPFMSAARKLIRHLAEQVTQGKAVAFHCRAGIGRSPMMAAATLAMAGVPVEKAVGALSQARGFVVPETEEQRAWIDRFMDSAGRS